MPAKPIIATNPQTGEKLQLVNNTWVPMQDPASTVPKIDPQGFLDAQLSLEDLGGIEGRAKWNNTGMMASAPIIGMPTFSDGEKGKDSLGFNQGAYDLNESIKPIVGRGMIGRLMQMKMASPNGSSGLGSLNQSEGDALRSTMGNLNVRMSTDQFKGQIARTKEILQRSYPGLTPQNPIDMSKGQSRTQIPKGSWYKDQYGNVRRNDNMDKGNPKLQDLKGVGGTNDLYAKYGLERKK